MGIFGEFVSKQHLVGRVCWAMRYDFHDEKNGNAIALTDAPSALVFVHGVLVMSYSTRQDTIPECAADLNRAAWKRKRIVIEEEDGDDQTSEDKPLFSTNSKKSSPASPSAVATVATKERRPASQRSATAVVYDVSSDDAEWVPDSESEGPQPKEPAEPKAKKTRRESSFASLWRAEKEQLRSSRSTCHTSAIPKASASHQTNKQTCRSTSLPKLTVVEKTKAPTQSQFERDVHGYTRKLFSEFNANIFEQQLPKNLKITWSSRLRKCAGKTVFNLKGKSRALVVELSDKLLNTYERLRTTLCHELCHAAVVLIDGDLKEVHGPKFYRWANYAMQLYPELEISRCHTYEVDYEFYYKCTNKRCGFVYGRHSRSIDTKECGCGYCQAPLALCPPGKKPPLGVNQEHL
eukprot:TRINITY_DN1048_c0_g1_i3.p1 TRINITY_DN1048_c0_g1~~TRINITY_DN1048_c0_g1_i3.p1  ORF type:complete len:406 (-),score=59.38 TRINITY_DN1048_c0_g1_i3:220-1437(-)